MTPSIWSCIYHKLPLHEALRSLAAEGWNAAEIGTEHLVAIETGDAPARLADLAVQVIAETRMDCPQAHAFLAANVAQPDRDAAEADRDHLMSHLLLSRRLGVRNVVMHPGLRRGVTTRAERQEVRRLNREAFRRLGDRAGEDGMLICLENLMTRGFETAADMLDLLDEIDHPAVALTLDTSHAHASGLDVAATTRALGGKIAALHISDNNRSGDQHLAPGSGSIDWPAFMQALRDTGYTGILNLEIPGERHPVPGIQRLKLDHARRVAEWLASPACTPPAPTGAGH